MVFSTDHNERVDVPVNKIGTQGTQSLDKLTIQINKEDPNVLFHCTKNEVFHYGFPGDLVTFTEEIYNGKLHFLCSVWTSPDLAAEAKNLSFVICTGHLPGPKVWTK